MRIAGALIFGLTLCACSPSATGTDASATRPANVPGRQTSNHTPWADELGVAARIEAPRLETFWTGGVLPAQTQAEPLLAICVDTHGKYSSRRKGEDWKPRTDADLLHTLRLFAEESFDLDAQLSHCQVVLGVHRNAPMSAALGVQEMMAQARILHLFLVTVERPSVPLLLEISLRSEKPRSALLLALSGSGENFRARLGEEKTEGAKWAAELAAIAGRVQAKPELLEVSASTQTMLEVETALNACAKLGMTRVRLV